MEAQVLIIGGGLSGLYAAYRLQCSGVDFQLIEARDRLGGRILGESVPDVPGGARFDLGPSWIWPDLQPRIRGLLRELGLSVFEQYHAGDLVHETAADPAPIRASGPSGMRGSWRIAGGTQAMVTALADNIPASRIHLSHSVSRIQRRPAHIEVETDGARLRAVRAQHVLLAVPPRLLARSIVFIPALPEDLLSRLLATPTWMAGHAKLLAVYDTPFWRQQGLSGSGFSQRGPLVEFHDASPAGDGPYALFGFIGHTAEARRQIGRDGLLDSARRQLQRLFGEPAARPTRLLLKDWAQDRHTATQEDWVSPRHHPEYGLHREACIAWDGRLCLAASEAAPEAGGYLEGALAAAEQAIQSLSAAHAG